MKVSVSRGVTVNIGNYESSRVDLTVADVEVEAVEHLKEQVKEIDEYLKGWLEQAAWEIQEAAGVKPLPTTRFTGGRSEDDE